MAQIPEKILYVSPTFTEDVAAHEYNNIQSAIDAIPAWGRYMIMLCDNFSNVPTLVLTNNNITVKFNGQTEYGIVFAYGSPITTMGARQTLKFTNMTYIRGGEINANVRSGVGFYKCESVIAKIIVSDGARVYIYDSKFYGMHTEPAIETGKDANLTICDSFIKGGYHNPAINFTYELDGRVKISNSIILHYDGVGYAPLIKSGNFPVKISAHNCAGNEKLCDHDIVNLVNTYNNNIADPKITF